MKSERSMMMSVRMMMMSMTTLLLAHPWQQEGVHWAWLAFVPKEGNLGVVPWTVAEAEVDQLDSCCTEQEMRQWPWPQLALTPNDKFPEGYPPPG